MLSNRKYSDGGMISYRGKNPKSIASSSLSQGISNTAPRQKKPTSYSHWALFHYPKAHLDFF